ncbi:MAG: hypothetical protein IK106_06815 [Clostridiales bacterium]|nr:hypothetical protein [Clostridiales bacterium]
MLGDELKKSLEPIQASDELLEKTRRAIEAARIQQAQEALNQAEKSSRRTARRAMFIRAVVPVACVLILGIGIFFLIPKVGSEDGTRSGKKSPIREHNGAVNEVTAEIDSILGDSSRKTAQATSAASIEEWDSYEETTTADQIAEDTTRSSAETEGDLNKHNFSLGPSLKSGDIEILIPDYEEEDTVIIGDYILGISADRKSLAIQDSRTRKFLESNSNHEIPQLDLDLDETIYSISYVESSNTLYIVTIVSEGSDIECHVYHCKYKDGKVIGNQPVRMNG